MSTPTFPEDLQLQWEGSHPIFDDFPLIENTPKTGLAIRTMLSTRGSSLKDIVLGFCGYMTIFDSDTVKQSPYGQLLLALCAIILINPFEIRVLKGCGIDELIDSSDFDQETGERYLSKDQFESLCRIHDIKFDIISWLEQKKLVQQSNGKVYFSRKLKKGKVLQRV